MRMGSVSVMLVKLLGVLSVMSLGTRGRRLRRLRRRGSKSNTKMVLDLLLLLVWSAHVVSHIHVFVSTVIIAVYISVSDTVRTLLGVEQAKLGAFLRRIGPLRCHLLSPSASEGVVFGSDCMRMIVVVTCANLFGIEVGLVAYGGTTSYPFKLSRRKLPLSLGMFFDVLFPSTTDVTSTHKLCMFFKPRRNSSGAMDITLDKVDALLDFLFLSPRLELGYVGKDECVSIVISSSTVR